MQKGWRYAYCSAGQLIASWNYSGKDRLFKWLSHKKTLIERAPKMKVLRGCGILARTSEV
ncbi:MAG: hypothetical protein Q7S42_01335 [Candidatus Omnitrophota bacterium]|nr:hypothetical protein [Candidatus Omnitrophota bacterium]